MKIILTESQLRNIKEQLIGVSDYNPSSGKPMPNYEKDLKKTLSNVSADDATDYVSAGLDTIPGLGNLASFGVDVVHAVTYMYRYYNATSDEKKTEYAIMGFITFATAFIPTVGNLTNVASRNILQTYVRRTPEEVLHILKKAGLYKKVIYAIQKYKWKFSFGLFLYKVMKSEIEDVLPVVNNKLTQILNKVKNTPLHGPVNDFKNMVDMIKQNGEVFKSASQYV